MTTPESRSTKYAGAAMLAAYGMVLVAMEMPEAVTFVVMSALFAYAVRWLTEAPSFIESFRWFRRYPMTGAFLLLVVGVWALLPSVLAPLVFGANAMDPAELPEHFSAVPVYFLWFWTFAAVGTRLQSRRDKKLIRDYEAQRANRDSNSDQSK